MAELLGPGGTGVTSPGVYSNGGSSNGAAPDSWWDQLAQALESSGASKVFRIILNRQGDQPDDDPGNAASFVEGGGVWIDWCDWPWYYTSAGQVRTPGQGFETFNVQGLGSRVIPYTTAGGFGSALESAIGAFLPGVGATRQIPFGWSSEPWAPLINPHIYPYNRGLVTFTADNTRGIQTQAPWIEVNYAAPSGVEHIYIYSTLRIPAGNGAGNYFYAAVSRSVFGANTGSAVQPAAYVPFVLAQLGFTLPTVATTTAPAGTTRSTAPVLTGSPGPGLPTLVSCQSQTFSTANEGQSLGCVKSIQTRLNELINAGLTVDGYFGPLTQAAVKEFQRQQGITVDGVVGPETWGRLENPQGAPATTHATTAATASVTTTTAVTLPSPASSSPSSSTAPTTGTSILGIPTGSLEVGAVIVGVGLLALTLLNRS